MFKDRGWCATNIMTKKSNQEVAVTTEDASSKAASETAGKASALKAKDSASKAKASNSTSKAGVSKASASKKSASKASKDVVQGATYVKAEPGHESLRQLIEEGLFLDRSNILKKRYSGPKSRYDIYIRPSGFGKTVVAQLLEALFTHDKDTLEGTEVLQDWNEPYCQVVRLDFAKIAHKNPLLYPTLDVSSAPEIKSAVAEPYSNGEAVPELTKAEMIDISRFYYLAHNRFKDDFIPSFYQPCEDDYRTLKVPYDYKLASIEPKEGVADNSSSNANNGLSEARGDEKSFNAELYTMLFNEITKEVGKEITQSPIGKASSAPDDGLVEDFSTMLSVCTERNSMGQIRDLLARCRSNSRVLIIDNFDEPLLTAMHDTRLYNYRSRVILTFFNLLGYYKHVFRHVILLGKINIPYRRSHEGYPDFMDYLPISTDFGFSAGAWNLFGFTKQDLLTPQYKKHMSRLLRLHKNNTDSGTQQAYKNLNDLATYIDLSYGCYNFNKVLWVINPTSLICLFKSADGLLRTYWAYRNVLNFDYLARVDRVRLPDLLHFISIVLNGNIEIRAEQYILPALLNNEWPYGEEYKLEAELLANEQNAKLSKDQGLSKSNSQEAVQGEVAMAFSDDSELEDKSIKYDFDFMRRGDDEITAMGFTGVPFLILYGALGYAVTSTIRNNEIHTTFANQEAYIGFCQSIINFFFNNAEDVQRIIHVKYVSDFVDGDYKLLFENAVSNIKIERFGNHFDARAIKNLMIVWLQIWSAYGAKEALDTKSPCIKAILESDDPEWAELKEKLYVTLYDNLKNPLLDEYDDDYEFSSFQLSGVSSALDANTEQVSNEIYTVFHKNTLKSEPELAAVLVEEQDEESSDSKKSQAKGADKALGSSLDTSLSMDLDQADGDGYADDIDDDLYDEPIDISQWKFRTFKASDDQGMSANGQNQDNSDNDHEELVGILGELVGTMSEQDQAALKKFIQGKMAREASVKSDSLIKDEGQDPKGKKNLISSQLEEYRKLNSFENTTVVPKKDVSLRLFDTLQNMDVSASNILYENLKKIDLSSELYHQDVDLAKCLILDWTPYLDLEYQFNVIINSKDSKEKHDSLARLMQVLDRGTLSTKQYTEYSRIISVAFAALQNKKESVENFADGKDLKSIIEGQKELLVNFGSNVLLQTCCEELKSIATSQKMYDVVADLKRLQGDSVIIFTVQDVELLSNLLNKIFDGYDSLNVYEKGVLLLSTNYAFLRDLLIKRMIETSSKVEVGFLNVIVYLANVMAANKISAISEFEPLLAKNKRNKAVFFDKYPKVTVVETNHEFMTKVDKKAYLVSVEFLRSIMDIKDSYFKRTGKKLEFGPVDLDKFKELNKRNEPQSYEYKPMIVEVNDTILNYRKAVRNGESDLFSEQFFLSGNPASSVLTESQQLMLSLNQTNLTEYSYYDVLCPDDHCNMTIFTSDFAHVFEIGLVPEGSTKKQVQEVINNTCNKIERVHYPIENIIKIPEELEIGHECVTSFSFVVQVENNKCKLVDVSTVYRDYANDFFDDDEGYYYKKLKENINDELEEIKDMDDYY